MNGPYPILPHYRLGTGISTDFGTLLSSGSRVAAYVCSDTSVDRSTVPGFTTNAVIYTTLNAGLAQCRSGQNDVVLVLPGHAESISAPDFMSSLKAGTTIVGLGVGTNRPTFTWTAATATFLFDVANTVLANCILEMAGSPSSTTALSVAAPITVSAAGCALVGCLIRTSVDADQLATIPITTTAAGDDFSMVDVTMYGATAGESTAFVRLVGADRFRMDGCYLDGATSSTTVGVVQCITTASTNIRVRKSTFINRKAASVHAVTGLAACTGVFEECNFGILDNATLAGLVTPGDLMGFRNKTVNLAGEQGGETSTVSA